MGAGSGPAQPELLTVLSFVFGFRVFFGLGFGVLGLGILSKHFREQGGALCWVYELWSFFDRCLPKPTKPYFLSCPYKSHIRAYNKNLQKSRVW